MSVVVALGVLIVATMLAVEGLAYVIDSLRHHHR